MKKALVIISAFLFFVSCDDSEKYNKIQGEWVCSQWIIESSGADNCKDNVYFKFKSDKTYESKINGAEESGVYSIANGLLYSTPRGKLKIGVELNKLSADTLEFVMSRSGAKETLTLVRKNN